MRIIRIIAIIVICFAILYFILGFIIVEKEFFTAFTQLEYNKYGVIIGSIASVLGLLAMLRPPITTADLKRLETNSLRQVADLADEMRKADKKIEQRSKQLLTLEDRNKNLELQIRKASMVLFLKKKLEKNYSDLTEIYHESVENKKRLDALNEEITDSIDSAVLTEIMYIIEEREKQELLNVDSMFWLKPNFMGIGIDVNAMTKFLQSRLRKIINKE